MPPPIAWETWITQYGAKLLLYARRWTSNQAEAEDWVQECFTRFWSRRHEIDDPVVYLFRSVRNIAIDTSRRQQSQQRRDEELSHRTGQHAQFHCRLEDDEWRHQIETALQQLPQEQAEVITLKIWSQLTFAQISELTQTPIGTVTSRYRYALNTLKSSLSEHAFE